MPARTFQYSSTRARTAFSASVAGLAACADAEAAVPARHNAATRPRTPLENDCVVTCADLLSCERRFDPNKGPGWAATNDDAPIGTSAARFGLDRFERR